MYPQRGKPWVGAIAAYTCISGAHNTTASHTNTVRR